PARLSALPAPLPNVERLTADAVPPAQIANRENARLIVPKQRDTLFHRTGLLEGHRPTSSNRATTLTCQESTRSKLSGLSPVCTLYPLRYSETEFKRLERQGAFLRDLTEDVLRRAGLALRARCRMRRR